MKRVVDQRADALLGKVFFAFCKGADTPVSLGAWLRFKHGEFAQLVSMDCNPLHYNDRLSFEKDYAVVKFLSKNKDLDTRIDIEAVALDSWKAAEISCAQTNRDFRLGRLRGFSPRVEAVLFTAKRKIASVLGPLKLVQAFESCGWGPGATFSLKGDRATLDDKIREYPINVTKRALPYIRAVIESDPHWLRAIGIDAEGPLSLLPCCFTTVRGCRATLVDKSAKTKRAIAIEPTGNIFLQLGIGKLLRRRLRRVGIDLNDQTRNQDLACQGSLTDDLATIDLSSASDTVSRELVYELLPLDWFNLLDQVRSPEISWNKEEWLKVEKFSSMGNGFTFELESLIFWGLTSAVMEVGRVEGALGVYGDDIICPSMCVPLLTEVLTLCGFTLNKSKSFATGYFRESCGKHFWKGYDVTPPYQKESPGKPQENYRLANRLYRYAVRRTSHGDVARRSWVSASWLAAIEVVCEFAHKYISRKGRYTLRSNHRDDAGPTWRDDAVKRGFGVSSLEDVTLYLADRRVHVIPFGNQSDDGLMLPWRLLKPFICSSNEHGWIKLPVYTFRPSKRKLSSGEALYAYWLRFGSEEEFKDSVTPRGRGQWSGRRRWFYDGCYADLSTLDVAPA